MDGNNTYKKIQTWKEKYGVEWCSQNSEVIKKHCILNIPNMVKNRNTMNFHGRNM